VKAQLDEYVLVRRAEKAAGATIQRELSLLQKILNYSEAPNIPAFPRMKESAPREGFIKPEDFNRLRSAITDGGLHGLVGLAYKFSFRKDEILNLLVRQLDGRKLKLFKGTTKNSKPRELILDASTLTELQSLIGDKGPDEYIFTWQTGHAKGKPIRDFRASWTSACKAAGVRLHFHDLRRSAIRNMMRRGISQPVAMKISGHLTPSVFNRYNITDEEDLIDAAKRIEQGAHAVTISANGAASATQTAAVHSSGPKKSGKNLAKKYQEIRSLKMTSDSEPQN
jgi:integrase